MAVAKTIPITQAGFNVSANAGTLQPGCVYIIDRQSARLALTARMSVGLRDEVNWADIQGKPDLDRPVHWDNIEGKPELNQPVHWNNVQGKPAFGNAARATLTAGREDGTSGRVLRVGDYSIGTLLVHANGRDLNALPLQCMVFTGKDLINNPVGAGYTVVQQWVNSVHDTLQFVSGVHTPDEQIYYRRKRTGHWRPWQRLVTDGTPMTLRNKVFSGHKELPYKTTPTTAGANVIDLNDPHKGLQYLRPGNVSTMSINYSRAINDATDEGRSVLVYLRPQANVTITAHEVVAWPAGRNVPSPVFPANKTSMIRFQHVHFWGDRAFWYAKPEPGAWNA